MMDMKAGQVRSFPQAAELLADWHFLPSQPPGQPAAQAVETLMHGLRDSSRFWAYADEGQWRWLAGLTYLPFDSKLFGRRMAKVDPLVHLEPWPSAQALAEGREMMWLLLDRASANNIKYLSARVMSQDILSANVLETVGFRLMDASVEWELNLDRAGQAGGLPAGYGLAPAAPETQAALADLAVEAFCDLDSYADRFAMDHALRPDCPAMYRTWLANSFSGDQADHILALSHESGPVGFITLKLPRGNTVPGPATGWVVMNALSPAHRGKGLYHHLLAHGLAWLKTAGCQRARVRTKASQQAVIRAWSLLGARQAACDFTLHKWLGD